MCYRTAFVMSTIGAIHVGNCSGYQSVSGVERYYEVIAW